MDIVLDTTFGNPKLPIKTSPGFADWFSRPAASSLGSTDDGKAWRYDKLTTAETPAPWQIDADGHATSAGNVSGALVDGHAADGTLTAVLARRNATGGAASPRSGIIFRYTNPTNFLGVYGTSGAAPYLVVVNTSSGAPIVVHTSNILLADGDQVQAEFVGTAVTVRHNGALVWSGTIAQNTTGTVHGLAHRASTGYASWRSIEFEPR